MKTILTVVGSDRPGIVAGISQQLFKLNINILDIRQTIVDGYFTMFMLLDLSQTLLSFEQIKDLWSQLESSLNLKINMQREEIFNAMHTL